MLPSLTDFAWAAGIIDGEGYIGMRVVKPGTNRRKTFAYQIQVVVVMTHEATIQKLCDIFGGVIGDYAAKDPTKHAHNYRWYVGDLKADEVLRKILLYLVTKKKQALLVLDYRAKCTWSDSEELKISYYEQLCELNRKGPKT